jgi:fibro-slime domain-containing protein
MFQYRRQPVHTTGEVWQTTPTFQESVMRTITTTTIASAALLAAAAGVLAVSQVSSATASASASASPDTYSHLPSSLELAATIRDFSHTHPDFQSYSGNTTVGLVQSELGEDGLPALKSLRGFKIDKEFKDTNGRNINPAVFDPSKGDTEGRLVAGGTGNGLTSAESFAQWYRDEPGVNMAKSISLTLNRIAGTNRYVFDSKTDEPYGSRGGFYPINDQLMGNYANTGKNFHFTTEVRTQFVYEEGGGQVFTFSGDDDVWVFVDGQLVIDLGGLHPRRVQTIDLDRLDWLEHGQVYSLDIFHAERRTTQSNFRVETNIRPYTVDLPQTLTLFD